MSVFVCGDTHIPHDIDKLNTTNWPEQKELTQDDLLIVLGDFGLIWSLQESKDEQYWSKWLLKKNCTVAFLDGNHEQHQRLSEFPISEKWGGKVQIVKSLDDKHIYHLMRGEVYEIEDHSIFVMGGADSIDKERRRIGISWWPEELPSLVETMNADKNLDKYNNEVDFILTHTCPRTILGKLGLGNWYSSTKMKDPTTEILESIRETVKFKQWHFGHMHTDMDIMGKFFCHYEDSPYKLI